MLTAGPKEHVQGSPTGVLQRHPKGLDTLFLTKSGACYTIHYNISPCIVNILYKI
jgi:hypothetical protein